MTRVIVAPDSFKESLASPEVADAIVPCMARTPELLAAAAERAEAQEFTELHKRVLETLNRRRDISLFELTINVAGLPFKVAADGHEAARSVDFA